MQEISKERTSEIFEECIQICTQHEIPISCNIGAVAFSNANTTWGTCKRIDDDGQLRYIIRISDICRKCGEDAVRETLLHELLHTCDDCRNHGVTWKNWAHRLNSSGYSITTTNSLHEKAKENAAELMETLANEGKYVLECDKCHTKIIRKRESNLTRHPERYRCKCGGRIKRIK